MRGLLVLAVPFLLAAAPAASELVVSGDGIVDGEVAGVDARIRIDPGAVAVMMLSPGLQRETGLEPSFFDFEYRVGPRKVEGWSQVTRIDIGEGSIKRRVGWTDRRPADDADAVIGPGMLRADRIRFDLRPARPGETTVALKMVGQGGLESKWGERFALLRIGDRDLRVQFAPNDARSVATASAGALLAATHDGRFVGDTENVPIAFGIERPVRTMRMAKPFAVGQLAIGEVGVRTFDHGSAASIPDARPRDPDPDEIVVTGKKARSKKVDQLKLGADVLDRCSSILFDRRADRIELTCLPG